MALHKLTYREFEETFASTPGIFDDIDSNASLHDMYIKLDLPTQNGMSKSAIGNHIRQLLDELTNSKEVVDKVDLNKWCAIGAIDSILDNDGKPTEGFIAIDAVRGYRSTPVDWTNTDVTKIISLAKGLRKLNNSYQKYDFQYRDPRLYHIATAIRTLRTYGCEVDYETGDVKITSGETAYIEQIGRHIRRFGALKFIIQMFKSFKADYYETADRLVLAHAPQLSPYDNKPLPPVAFLMNLAAKYAHRPTEGKNSVIVGSEWRLAFEMATALFTITDSQRYGIFEMALFTTKDMADHILKRLTFDACFTIPQTSLSSMPDELHHFFDWVPDANFKALCGYSIYDYIRVAQVIAGLCKGKLGPVSIKQRQIHERLGKNFSTAELRRILEDISHPLGSINENISRFLDQTSVNVYLRPLAILNPGAANRTYYVLDARWTAIGFFEVLYKRCRTVQNYITKIGNGLENLVKDLLSHHKIDFCSGKYFVDDKEGDSDILIETDSHIILVEIKKTQLTRTAQAGDVLHAFMDISEALVKSQEQAGRIEIILRTKGYIRLINKELNVTKIINWNNRKIERISITHLDFFSLHDRPMMMRLLEMLLDVQLQYKGIEQLSRIELERLKKLNNNLEKLTEQYQEIYKDIDSGRDKPYFDCWFIPLGFLRLLLTDTVGAEQFLLALQRMKYVSFGTGNLYQEFRLRAKLSMIEKDQALLIS